MFFDPSVVYCNTSVSVASQTLVCSFFCAVGQLFRETRVLIMVSMASPLVSTSVEHVLQKRGSVSFVFLFCVHLAVSLSLCYFVIRAQIEKCSQVALVSAEPFQELSFC